MVGRGAAANGSGRLFVGRAQELARLRALVEAVAAGDGRVVVLEGEAGIGKSRLARELLADCISQGFRAWTAAAVSFFSGIERLTICLPEISPLASAAPPPSPTNNACAETMSAGLGGLRRRPISAEA